MKRGKRNILLLEPNYKNKYPPIGLMKISTYHKSLGDNVTFYKGDLSSLLFNLRLQYSIRALKRILKRRNDLAVIEQNIAQYLKTRKLEQLKTLLDASPKKHARKVEEIARWHAYNIPKDNWDRIYVTTLFTFYWDVTVSTIDFAKKLVTNCQNVMVGGVMASLLKNEIEAETGIKPITGLLNEPGILDSGNRLIVDELMLDYSILDEISYRYPTRSAFFTYMTKGCTRKCSFCSVPKLEPTYVEKVSALNLFSAVRKQFGDQRNLMLMDNNVLASPKFPEIVEEIKQMGFIKGAMFVEPNQLAIAISNLRAGINDFAFKKKALALIFGLRKRVRGSTIEKYELTIKSTGLADNLNIDKQTIIRSFKKINPFFERYRSKVPMKRYVDFNQGIDARYVTEENMRLMSELPLKPLRIAFDHISIKETYIRAVELAAQYDIRDLSNYILYNFQDKPIDFYERLRINVDLGKRLNVTIFSFPMKYVPLFGEEAKGRKHVGKHWNKKYLRAIQCMLNATKGIVAPGYDFFQMSFGSSFEEFSEILMMPESYIVNRIYFENNGMKTRWKLDFDALTVEQRQEATEIILRNDFKNITKLTSNISVLRLLSHYTQNSKNKLAVNTEVRRVRKKFDSLIKKDMFIELTLTHDFENRKMIC